MPRYLFTPTHKTLADILTDRNLAQLGDAYINFIYSLAQSSLIHRPTGKKLKGTLLAQALRNASLRQRLPSRTTTHSLADAAEALLVYAWLHNCTTLREGVETLAKNKHTAEALTQLLLSAKKKIKLF